MARCPAMTDLRSAVSDYLTVRRQLGFALKEAGQDLERFIEFMDHAGAERVTSELALMWATSVSAHPHRWRRRLGVVRGFARYLSTIDPQTEVPSEDLLRASLPRVAPYLYSDAEIEALMRAASELTPRLRAATFETLIGLMAVIGLRAGEALGLDRAAVDLQNGLLHVRSGKWAANGRCRCTTQPPAPFAITARCATSSFLSRRQRRSSSPIADRA